MSTEDPSTQTDVAEPVGDQGPQGTPSGTEDPDVFPRSYVEELRAENAKHRTRAQRADEALAKLTALLVEKTTTGVLADPTDLPVTDDLQDEEGWPDPEKIAAAAADLVARKPHLRARTVEGEVGQGVRGDVEESFSLAAALRAGAA